MVMNWLDKWLFKGIRIDRSCETPYPTWNTIKGDETVEELFLSYAPIVISFCTVFSVLQNIAKLKEANAQDIP